MKDIDIKKINIKQTLLDRFKDDDVKALTKRLIKKV
jgi:hypothetical protein